MFVLNDGNERIKNQEKYRMSTSRRNQLAGRKTLPKNTRRKKKRGRKMLRIIMIPLLILLLFLLFKSCTQKKNQYADVDATQPEMDVQLLDVNPYSRPGTTIDHVRDCCSITQRIQGVQRRITEIILMVSKIAMRLRQAVIL